MRELRSISVHSQGTAQTVLGSPTAEPDRAALAGANRRACSFSAGFSTTRQPVPLHCGQSALAMLEEYALRATRASRRPVHGCAFCGFCADRNIRSEERRVGKEWWS